MDRKWRSLGKLPRRSLLRSIGYFLLVFFVFLAIARFIDFPVSMFVVAGRSMEPSLYIGDMVFCLKGDYSVGDIVVVGGVSRMGCIVHRVVSIAGNTVTTKGDANPGPDRPVAKENVLYKVVLVVQRLLWIPPVLGVSLFLGFRYLRSLIHGSEVGRVLVAIVLFFSTLNIVFMTLIPIFHVHQSIPLNSPSIRLRSISVSSDFRFFKAVYEDVRLLEFVRVDSVTVNASGREFVPEEFFVENNTLVVRIPREVYEALYASSSGTSSFWVYCCIIFDKGSLYGYYPVSFSWRNLEINMVNNTFIVFNPNPIVFNASFEIQYYDVDRFGKPYYVSSEKFNQTLQPVSSFTIKPEKNVFTCYVIMRYVFLGNSIMESRKVDLVGG